MKINFSIQNNNIISDSYLTIVNKNENNISLIHHQKFHYKNKKFNNYKFKYNKFYFIGQMYKNTNIQNLKKKQKKLKYYTSNFALSSTGQMMDVKSTNKLDYVDDVNLKKEKKYNKTKVILYIWVQKSKNENFDLCNPLNEIIKIDIGETNENILVIEFSKSEQKNFYYRNF